MNRRIKRLTNLEVLATPPSDLPTDSITTTKTQWLLLLLAFQSVELVLLLISPSSKIAKTSEGPLTGLSSNPFTCPLSPLTSKDLEFEARGWITSKSWKVSL